SRNQRERFTPFSHKLVTGRAVAVIESFEHGRARQPCPWAVWIADLAFDERWNIGLIVHIEKHREHAGNRADYVEVPDREPIRERGRGPDPRRSGRGADMDAGSPPEWPPHVTG